MIDRLRVKLRGEGKRFDVLDAVLATGADDDLVRVMKRVQAMEQMLQTEDGKNLLSAYRRAANILKVEDAKDGPHQGQPDAAVFRQVEENNLQNAIDTVRSATEHSFRKEDFAGAMTIFAATRPTIDAFFQNVTVNDPDPQIRQNRLRLLAQLRDTMHKIADFSKIEG